MNSQRTLTFPRRFLPALLAGLALVSALTDLYAAGKGFAIGERLEPDRAQPAGSPYQAMSWNDLLPPGWNPAKVMDLSVLQSLDDNDPRAQAALEKLRTLLDNAPVRQDLDRRKVRLSGFLVPLDVAGGPIHEFLLVPHFGACIHTPPPPANQLVHVVLDRPASGFYLEDAVTVLGELQVAGSETRLGHAGYRIRGQQVLHHRR